ncbi:MAG: hypothetical protein EOP06_19930 [Proteobacteria bacterium]|nr:MAG: hypothetical protein EOP06_19930 [Pseudomonadota bacterium]
MRNSAVRFLQKVGLLKLFICGFVLGSAPVATVHAAETNKVVVAYFSKDGQENFEKKIKPLFEEFKGDCKSCEIINATPYDAKGNFNETDMATKLKSPPEGTSFYLFDWNQKTNDVNRGWTEILEQKIQAGIPVLGSTGHAAPDEPGSPLSRTVFGQISGAIIIGEVTGRERMLPKSYFGPEMLTAIAAPSQHQGKEVAPLYFAGRWASSWSKRSAQEWLTHFRTKKQKSRRIFVDMNDLFVK